MERRMQASEITMNAHQGRVARGLLLCTVAMFLSCVLPPAQDDTILTAPPLIYNRPPHIIEQGVSPPRVVNLTEGCGIGTFSVQAEDPDLCDPITVAWYLDYDPNAHTQPIYTPDPVVQPDAPNANTNPIRDLSSTDLGPGATSAFANSATNPLSAGTHVLEAFVTDGLLGPDNGTSGGRNVLPRAQFEICYTPPFALCDAGVGCVTPAIVDVILPDGGQAFDPTYFSTYAWTIKVSTGTCP
jgi:hypothetical protein